LVAAGLFLRFSGSLFYARWISISLCVYCMYACVCIHLGECVLVAGVLDSLMSQSQ
jgi:hypothetical protein